MRWSEKFKWAAALAIWVVIGLTVTRKVIELLYC